MIDILEKIQNNSFKKGKLYLLEKPSSCFGFFYQDGIVYFAKKSENDSKNLSIDTSFLDMHSNVYITSEEAAISSFESGYYDMLAYRGDFKDDNFDVFHHICSAYANDSGSIDFQEFFSALVELFRNVKCGSAKNAIGLMGELVLIKYVYEKFGVNISENWHLPGSLSKLDFNFHDFNVEVKTSTGTGMTFLLKHEQIFNNQRNYVCIISLIETGEGESILSLAKYFENYSPFKNNIKFQIAIQREINKFSGIKELEKSYALDSIDLFECSKMKTIGQIPPCISNIQYQYNFINDEPVGLDKIFN